MALTRLIRPCLIAGLTLLIQETLFSAAEDPPNIVVIFTDDQGYGDAGCYGATDFKTPHLDQMASEGLKLTSFYAAASVCSASRAALLTGRYPDRIGVTGVFFPTRAREGQEAGPGKDGLAPKEVTIAELLKKQGYATACFGKWHLGDAARFLPTRQGFDRYFGIPYSNDMGWWQGKPPGFKKDFPPIPLLENESIIETNPDQRHLTRRYTEETIEFIRDHKEQPFFIYLAHTMPHVPLFVSERFSGSAAYGLYGDVIEEIDWSVGVVLRALEQEGIDDRTLVIFTSDNGPWLSKGAHGGNAGPLRDGKFTRYEGGHRVPCLMRWPGTLKAGRELDGIASTIDLLPTLAGLAGARLPDDRKIDGVDLWPHLSEKKPSSPRTTFFYSPWVVRHQKWKLLMPGKYREFVSASTDGKSTDITYDHARLYDLDADIGETSSLHEKNEHKELIESLTKLCTDHQVDLKGPDKPGTEEEDPDTEKDEPEAKDSPDSDD